jgi:hypothetical protein
MIYREFLVMRKAVPVFLGCVAALFILVSLSHVNTNFVQSINAGAWFGALFASIFGVALGNSSREGARVFWVLPKARWQSALGIVAIDILSTAFVVCASSVIIGGVASAFAALPGNSMHWNFSGNAALNAICLAVAVYAWSAIVGMVGRRLPYVGVSVMPVLMVWFGFAMSQGAIGEWMRKPIAANPFALYLVQQAGPAKGSDIAHMGLTWVTPETAALSMIVIMLVGCIASIVMWSKTEVLA